MMTFGIRTLLTLLFGFWVAFVPQSSHAEPYVEHVEPASVTRGQHQRITLVGTDVDRAIGLWTSLPEGKLKASPMKTNDGSRTELEIEVAPDCPLGLYGLRLASEDGLSNLCLFLVDDVALQPARETPYQSFPVALAGAFRAAAADRFSLQVAAGQKLTFDVVASRLGTDADPLITIFDPSGRRVVQRDNDPGLFFDCCFEQTFATAGIYTVELRDARFQGSPHWQYVLRVGNFPAARVAVPSAVRAGETTSLTFPELPEFTIDFAAPATLPLGSFFHTFRRPTDHASNWVPLLSTDLRNVVESETNNAPDVATPAGDVPVLLHGTLDPAGDRDLFSLELKQGEKIVIRAETRPLSSAADVELTLFDPTGREIQRIDDVTLPGNVVEEATITYVAPKAGTYRLQVRETTDQGGSQFAYRVEVRPNLPRIQLTSPVAAVAVPQRSYQRLPITVVRTDYNGPIELSLVGAPAGVKLEPNVIPEKELILQCQLSAATETPLGIASFSIIGRCRLDEKEWDTPVVVQPLVDRQLINVDLIKYALRDNQRWLPPSVTNQLALQVTPTIPFAVELTETNVLLPRYQQVALKVETPRATGFESPIQLSAAGGQLGKESQGRRQVFGRFPTVAANESHVVATIHSRSQANELKELVDVTAVTKAGSRSITLFRSFLLDVRPVFALTLDPPTVPATPGSNGSFKIAVERLNTFTGPVTIEPLLSPGITLPEKIMINAGEKFVDVPFAVEADFKPAKRRIRLPATAQVNGFQEEPRAIEVEIDVKLAAQPDKK